MDRLSGGSKQADNSCPDSHVEISLEQRAWVAEQGTSVEEVLRWQRLQMERPQVTGALMRSLFTGDEGRRALLLAVHDGGSATYEDVEAGTRFSRRTLRRRAVAMEDEGLLDIKQGRPTVIGWADEGVAVLAEHALHLWEQSWE